MILKERISNEESNAGGRSIHIRLPSDTNVLLRIAET